MQRYKPAPKRVPKPDMNDKLVLFHNRIQPTSTPRMYVTDAKISSFDNATIQFHIPPYYPNNVIYFEVEVINIDKNAFDGAVGIGLAPKNYNKGMVGWHEESIGYHGDDGTVYTGQNHDDDEDDIEILDTEEADNMNADDDEGSWESVESNEDVILDTFGEGDVVGLLWDKNTGKIKFSKNGKYTTAEYARHTEMYPTISADRGITFSVNFGESELFMMKNIPQEKTCIQMRNKLQENRKYSDLIIIN